MRGREAQREGVRGDRDMQSGRPREKLRMLRPRITEREGARDRDIPRDTQRQRDKMWLRNCNQETN